MEIMKLMTSTILTLTILSGCIGDKAPQPTPTLDQEEPAKATIDEAIQFCSNRVKNGIHGTIPSLVQLAIAIEYGAFKPSGQQIWVQNDGILDSDAEYLLVEPQDGQYLIHEPQEGEIGTIACAFSVPNDSPEA